MGRTPYVALVCLLLAVKPFALYGSDERAEELLARHLTALGGKGAVQSIVSVVSTAEIEILGTGLKGTIDSRSLHPCLSYSELSLGFFRVREGYDGERLWMVDPNGKLQFRRDAASLEYQRTTCLLDSEEYLFGGGGFELSAAGRDTAAGASCEVLLLEVEGGTAARLFLNDSTYLIERIVLETSEGTVIETYGDYRQVSGVMFPFYERTELPAMGQKIETRYQTIVPNETIDPVIFLPPAADVRDYRFTSSRGAEEIPFVYRYRHLFVPARIAGREGEVMFLLDSGASMTVIDSSIAAEMRLPQGGVMPGAGAGGMTSFSLTRIPGLAIGGIEFSEQTAISFPLSGLLSTFREMDVGGILGYDFLSRFITRIDYDREIFSLFDPDSFPPQESGTIIEAPLRHSIFSFEAALDGVRGAFYLDTGANSSLLYGIFADSTGLLEGKRLLPMKIRGAGGEEEASLCRFDSLRIGGIAITRPVFAITRGARGISVLESVDGVIGNDVLERFTVTLDYRDQRVLLEKNARFNEPFFRDRSGLELARMENGRFLVLTVIPDSPAAEALIRSGDVIARIERTRAERFKSLRELMNLFEAKAGTSYTIEIQRGRSVKHVTLKLAEYI